MSQNKPKVRWDVYGWVVVSPLGSTRHHTWNDAMRVANRAAYWMRRPVDAA